MKASFTIAAAVFCLAGTACKKPPPPAPPPPKEEARAPKPPERETANEKTGERHGHAGAPLPFGERPPKPEKIAAPHVPELPELAKQEREPPPSKRPAVGEYACGASHSGNEDYPLMCLEERNHEKNEKVARVLVPYGHFREKRAPLPRVVDHREEHTESEVRNQGTAGTCTTFATASAIDHSVTRWSGVPSHISTMELWGRYHQPSLPDALIATVGQTFAAEDLWPYNAKAAWPWRNCERGREVGKAEGPCGRPVDREKLSELERRPEIIVEQVEWLPSDFEVIRHKIAGGQDPVFAIKLPRHFKPVGKPGSRYIPDYKDEAGGHALALAGYAIGDKGDNYYLIHNSWGPGWGDDGYAWMHEATIARHMLKGFGIIDARPIKGAKAHREGKVCPRGHAPDSLTGGCEEECKEGGPKHNGICADPHDCPAGYVNLFGECVAAAPVDRSKDEKTGISWSCGIGGCAWELPKSVGKCEREPCMLSCPAPAFRVAKDEHGLTCVE